MTSNFKIEAQQLLQTRRESIEYFVKPENSLERSIAQVFLEATEAK